MERIIVGICNLKNSEKDNVTQPPRLQTKKKKRKTWKTCRFHWGLPTATRLKVIVIKSQLLATSFLRIFFLQFIVCGMKWCLGSSQFYEMSVGLTVITENDLAKTFKCTRFFLSTTAGGFLRFFSCGTSNQPLTIKK